jgi:hypothetical protein
MKRSVFLRAIEISGKPAGAAGRGAKSGGKGILVGVVKIKKLLRRRRGTMWLRRAECQKERLIFVLVEKLNGASGGFVIPVALTVAFESDYAIRLRRYGPHYPDLRVVVWLR